MSPRDTLSGQQRTKMGIETKAGHWGEETWNTKCVTAASGLAGAVTRFRPDFHVGLWRTVYRDYRRYRAAGARSALSVIGFTQGFWATAVFRLCHWLITRIRLRGVRVLVKIPCLLLEKFIEVLTGISIPAQCNIGPGLYVGHFGGIFIDARSFLGENCNVAQGVTIGEGGRGELHGIPVIGDRVHIGANAVILGKVTIGDDAVIGPGAVVMSSVPPRGVAMGNPARAVGSGGSFEFVNYDNMENDPARSRSLEQANEASSGGEGR
jgi:serine O-acetyltransferase